jgi:hypothetical protein
MRRPLLLLAIVLGLTVCNAVRAQDPVSYDPNFYDRDAYHARLLELQRAKRLKQQPGMLAKVETFASGVATSVATNTGKLVSLLSAANDPNNKLPQISSGPGSPLMQPGSLSGSAAAAQSPTPPSTPLFTTPPTGKGGVFPSIFGPPTASATGLGVPVKQ